MATQVQNPENQLPQRILQADGVFELILGAGLLLASNTAARWIGVSATTLSLVGLVLVAVGAWLVYISRRSVTRQTLRMIAFLNLVGAILIGLVLVLDWNIASGEGHWLFALVTGAVLILGLTELYAQRYCMSSEIDH